MLLALYTAPPWSNPGEVGGGVSYSPAMPARSDPELGGQEASPEYFRGVTPKPEKKKIK